MHKVPCLGHTGHCSQALADLLLATVISYFITPKMQLLGKHLKINQQSALKAELALRVNRTWNTRGGAGVFLEERVQVLETSRSKITPRDS